MRLQVLHLQQDVLFCEYFDQFPCRRSRDRLVVQALGDAKGRMSVMQPGFNGWHGCDGRRIEQALHGPAVRMAADDNVANPERS